MGRINEALTGSRLTLVTLHYYSRRGDSEMPSMAKKLAVGLQMMLQD